MNRIEQQAQCLFLFSPRESCMVLYTYDPSCYSNYIENVVTCIMLYYIYTQKLFFSFVVIHVYIFLNIAVYTYIYFVESKLGWKSFACEVDFYNFVFSLIKIWTHLPFITCILNKLTWFLKFLSVISGKGSSLGFRISSS